MSIKVGTSEINKILIGSTPINKIYKGTSVIYGGSGGGGGGSFTLGFYEVFLFAAGGGEVQFSIGPDGETYNDTSGWWDPITVGIGTGKWVIFTQTAGTLSCSGGGVGSRAQLTSVLTVTGSYFGSSNRFADFDVDIYDAATGGALLASGSLHLEVDGTA